MNTWPAYLRPGDVTAVEGENSEAAERLNVSRDVSRQPQPVVTERQSDKKKCSDNTHTHTHIHTQTHTHTHLPELQILQVIQLLTDSRHVLPAAQQSSAQVQILHVWVLLLRSHWANKQTNKQTNKQQQTHNNRQPDRVELSLTPSLSRFILDFPELFSHGTESPRQRDTGVK